VATAGSRGSTNDGSQRASRRLSRHWSTGSRRSRVRVAVQHRVAPPGHHLHEQAAADGLARGARDQQRGQRHLHRGSALEAVHRQLDLGGS
jgi:hypothetical protein